MNVTQDVITDLLPLYLAGEASEGTRVLVEDYLRRHPEFAATARVQAERNVAALGSFSATLPPDHEKAAFERTRRFNRRRQWLMALAIGLSLLPFSIVFTDDMRWMMLRDHPRQAAVSWIAAAGCWLVYYALGRRLRDAG